MVAGPRRDDHYRDVPPGGDPRDQSLGPVAAGHPEQVGSAVHRLPGQRGHIDDPGTLEQGHLGAERDGLVLQPELPDLPATRPRVHDHKRLPRLRRRIFGRTRGRVAAGERGAAGGDGGRREHDAERYLPQQPGNNVHDDHEHRGCDQDRGSEPAHDAAVGEEPPCRRAADRQAREAEKQRGNAPQPPEQQEHHHRSDGRREREPGQPALAAGGTLVLFVRYTQSARSMRRTVAPRSHVIGPACHARLPRTPRQHHLEAGVS